MSASFVRKNTENAEEKQEVDGNRLHIERGFIPLNFLRHCIKIYIDFHSCLFHLAPVQFSFQLYLYKIYNKLQSRSVKIVAMVSGYREMHVGISHVTGF